MREALIVDKQGVDEILLDIRGTQGCFQFALNIGGTLMSDRPMVTAGKVMTKPNSHPILTALH